MMARSRSASGFTLVQLLGWTAVVMALTFLLYPLFTTRDLCDGRPPTCMRNLKMLGLAMTMYVQDYDETYPGSDASNGRWGPKPWRENGEDTADFYGNSRWVAQLLPYVKDRQVFACPKDASSKRNQTSRLVPESDTPFPVSYGPNLLFVNPAAYGWKNRTLTTANVKLPAEKYFLADCATAHGFDLESVAYLRYPNYAPELRQDGWSPQQYRAAGRVAWPDKVAEPLTRHKLMTNVVFADGHAKSIRHDLIPDNDGRHGEQYPKLLEAMIPWQTARR